ncbi:MAG: pyridoxal-phosphate dependent enzyme [Acidobacteriota bacterium]
MKRAREWLQCLVCSAHYDLSPLWSGCPACLDQGKSSALEVRYDYASVTDFGPDEGAAGIWRWHRLLPAMHRHHPVSLKEGATPLCPVSCPAGLATIWLKNESVNPTWSYKDRANSVNISVARNLGFEKVAVVSTGNHGNAAAAYASAAGLRAAVLCHRDVSMLQASLMRLYGARVLRGGNRSAMLNRLIRSGSWFPCCVIGPLDGSSNPFGVEGLKTIAFEIFFQLGRRVPDRVFVPAGSGDGLYGIWKGFVELQKLGLCDRLPRMFACQAEGAAAYVRSFSKGLRHVEPVENPQTIALSIAEEQGGRPALLALYDSQGGALACSDREIIQSAGELARAGYALEPASAAALACARKEPASSSDENWVLIGTGAYAKWPETLNGQFETIPALEPDFVQVEQFLEL